MSKNTMNLPTALKVLKAVAVNRAKWGKQASPPYTMAQVMEALELAHNAELLEERVGKEEITKLKRQLAACTNREKGRKAKVENPNQSPVDGNGAPVDPDDGDWDA
jgi:hypothetical protein